MTSIDFTSFEHIHSSSKKVFSHTILSEYVYNDLVVYNQLSLPALGGGVVEINLEYASGTECIHQEYGAPSNALGNAHNDAFIEKITGLYESDLEDSDLVSELDSMAQELNIDLAAIGGVASLYTALCENFANAEEYRKDLELSSEVKDYDFDASGVIDDCIIYE